MDNFLDRLGRVAILPAFLAAAAPVMADEVLTTLDGVIRNTLCVGPDCTENNGNTIELRIKGPNPDLLFEDTSTGPFTTTDWLFYTAYIVVGPQPDMFGIRNEDTLHTPFSIQDGAESAALVVSTDSHIGIGTYVPSAPLHLLKSGTAFVADPDTLFLLQNTGNATDRARMSLMSGNQGSGQLQFGDTDSELAGRIRYFHTDDRMDFVTGFGQPPAVTFDSTAANVISTSTGARLSAGGVWTNASSRALKHDVVALDLDAALAALEALRPVAFRYDAQPEELTLGFIAEDVPDLVAMNGRETLSPMDVVAVLTRVVQAQMEVNLDLRERLNAQATEIAALRAAMAPK